MNTRTLTLIVAALFCVLLGISFLSIGVTERRIENKKKSDSIKADSINKENQKITTSDSIKNSKMVEDFINHSKL